ncbi:hypothetical protein [Nocardia testacea]|uniref:hypothetical protein n=1 Tax=Nocardia testacea TaxID=248551 RepID=UPI0033E3AF28
MIEVVDFPHLHTDHLGWARLSVPGSDLPAFGRAEYLVPEPEWVACGLPEASGTTEKIIAALSHASAP